MKEAKSRPQIKYQLSKKKKKSTNNISFWHLCRAWNPNPNLHSVADILHHTSSNICAGIPTLLLGLCDHLRVIVMRLSLPFFFFKYYFKMLYYERNIYCCNFLNIDTKYIAAIKCSKVLVPKCTQGTSIISIISYPDTVRYKVPQNVLLSVFVIHFIII